MLENLVTSKEMSQKLWDAGVRLEHLWHWQRNSGLAVGPVVKTADGRFELSNVSSTTHNDAYPAYTFQQLWEVLPSEISHKYHSFGELREWMTTGVLTLTEGLLTYKVKPHSGTKPPIFHTNGLPAAAAEALLWCLENDYIKLEDINE